MQASIGAEAQQSQLRLEPDARHGVGSGLWQSPAACSGLLQSHQVSQAASVKTLLCCLSCIPAHQLHVAV